MSWWERASAWDEQHRLPLDAVGAALLVLLMLVTAADPYTGERNVATVGTAVVMAAALAWRRSAPVASAVVVFAVALLHVVVLGIPILMPADLLVLVALHSVTVHGPSWAYRTALAGAFLGAIVLGVVLALGTGYQSVEGGFAAAVAVTLASTTVFALALVRRSRLATLHELRDRARRLEVEREQQLRIAAADERARIAREMHDIVAHSLSVIVAQADGGRYAAAQDPDAATRALTTVADTGRAALADMRGLLGVLRTEDQPAGAADGPSGPGTAAGTTRVPADLTPQPVLADVENLVRQVRDSGTRASLVRMGPPRRLPPGTAATVYRICQESLTNVLKHAGPDPTVTVVLQWQPASLVLEVTDDGRGASADDDGGGHGVLGMRERAVMLGGTLVAGPRPGGGYRVRAEIPVPAERAAPVPTTQEARP